MVSGNETNSSNGFQFKYSRVLIRERNSKHLNMELFRICLASAHESSELETFSGVDPSQLNQRIVVLVIFNEVPQRHARSNEGPAR